MSRTETDSFSYKCPCGAGTIEKTIVSTDYVFPSAKVEYSFQCAECIKVWRLSNGRLIQKESEKPYIEANTALCEARKAVLECIHRIAQCYCEQQSFATKKSEYEHLTTVGRFRKGYATYLKWRKEGRAMHKILVHEEPSSRGEALKWAKSVASSLGLFSELTEVLDQLSQREIALSHAERQIVYRAL